MSEHASHAPGTFCWADLATTDPAAARKFYGNLFGWGGQEIPLGQDMSYTLFQVGGRDVAGMGGLMPEQVAQGVPPHWMAYVASADVDRSAERAGQSGGAVLMPPMDVMDSGRMTMVRDPEGAIVALWQPKNHPGFGRRDEPNSLCWVELAVRHVDRAGAFYTHLFDWTTETTQMASGPYTMFKLGEQTVGGMWMIPANLPDVPPHWMVYFNVTDCDATFAQALSMGGREILPATDIPGVGRFATLKDPQGAVFSIIQMA